MRTKRIRADEEFESQLKLSAPKRLFDNSKSEGKGRKKELLFHKLKGIYLFHYMCTK